MLTGTGGNCGSLEFDAGDTWSGSGEIEFRDLFKVIWKEVRVAVCISLILATVNGIRIMIMGQGDALMALTIGLTMACAMVIIARLMYAAAGSKK